MFDLNLVLLFRLCYCYQIVCWWLFFNFFFFFNGFSFSSCLNLKWHVSYTFLWQRAAFPILRCTNCLGVGILASLGYNVPRFKTWELTDRFPGVPEGRVCQTVFSRSPSNFLLLGCLASCCTCFRGPVVMGFFGARKVDLYQPCKFIWFL